MLMMALVLAVQGQPALAAPPVAEIRAPMSDRALFDKLDLERAGLEEVRAAVEAGATTPRAVVERVYADVDRALWPAAELSVRAQLAFLEGTDPGRRPPGGTPCCRGPPGPAG